MNKVGKNVRRSAEKSMISQAVPLLGAMSNNNQETYPLLVFTIRLAGLVISGSISRLNT